jgi:hypothetical protein
MTIGHPATLHGVVFDILVVAWPKRESERGSASVDMDPISDTPA